LKFESKTPWSTARRPKKPKKSLIRLSRRKKLQKPIKGKKSGKAKKNGKEELGKAQKSKKNSNPRQKLKISTKAQNQHSLWNQLPLTLSMQSLPLR
jgi:hypothetical protein